MAYELMKGYLSKFAAAEAGQENKLGADEYIFVVAVAHLYTTAPL